MPDATTAAEMADPGPSAVEIEATAPRWLAGLNPQQRAAATHRGGHLVVAAGAGSGKTRTLAARVADLLAGGVEPERLLLLTFTRRAAREMLTRVQTLTGDARSRRVWGGTFHSVANRLLRLHGSAIGVAPQFTILDQGDTVDLFGLVRAEAGHADGQGRRFPAATTIAAVYSRVVNAGEPLDAVLARQFPWCSDHRADLADLFDRYTARKRAQGVLDLDDLLLYWRVLATAPTTGPILRERFAHVLVDEFQDTNTVQADILAAMATGDATLTVVGDGAQAIYGFRAATADHLLDFPARHAGATVVRLERNYRSTPEILATANTVMADAARRHELVLWTDRPAGTRPELVTCRDETTQATLVCDRILSHREAGIPLRDQAVLFRTSHHSDGLEVELGRRDIPYVKHGGLRFLEAAHVKDLLALLRLLDNPRDQLAWHRTLVAVDGVGPATARRLMTGIGVDDPGVDPLGRFLAADWPAGIGHAVAGELDALHAALEACATAADGDEPPPTAQIESLHGWCARTFPRRYDAAEARLADLARIARMAVGHTRRQDLVADLTIDPPASTSDLAGPPSLDDDVLTLSTIHSAKGGEWRAVHLIHAADGCLPSDLSLRDADSLEEERRLLYVALTRARDHLHVSYPLRFYHRRHGSDDAHTYAQASRFLAPLLDHFSLSEAVGDDQHPDAAVVGAPTTTAAESVGDYLTGLW